MEYSVAIKTINVNNAFNDVYKFVYECEDKDGQKYKFSTEAKIPMHNYIAIEFNEYTVEKGVVKPIGFSIYPLNVKGNRLFLYEYIYKSGNIPKIN